MSVPEVQNPTASTLSSTAAPRTRKRRRTPATGAANDCFTCSSQNLSCDRKRPYCTQCLEIGKGCAGYKTTLTWGVGVASRGKLRGLSLPVTDEAQQVSSRVRKSPRKTDTTNANASRRDDLKPTPTFSQPVPSSGFLTMTAANSGPLSMTWQSIPSATFAPHPTIIRSNPQRSGSSQSPELEITTQSGQPHQQAWLNSTDFTHALSGQGADNPPANAAPSSKRSFSSAFEALRPAHQNRTNAEDFRESHDANLQSPAYRAENSSSPFQSDLRSSHAAIPPTIPYDVTTPSHSHVHSSWSDNRQANQQGEDNDDVEVIDRSAMSLAPPSMADQFRQDALVLAPFPGVNTIGKTPRMQYLINYYTEVISPVIVAFDGPTNPYRSYILRLASGSETLQHAISALSASNLRQRRESGVLSTCKTDPARRSSMAHLTLTDKAWQSALGFLSVEDQRREENYHKNATVQLIQRQFADSSQHKDDSLLATLLVICLFHMCESGVAKFRTHFAGAKKLLAMRENTDRLDSKEAKWFIRMFTWFDAMTATVNEREGQMQDRFLDMSSLSDEDWGLENLAGCDGKLFKIIANLGRLNVLSQNGSACRLPAVASCSVPPMTTDFGYWNNLDGNGWITSDVSADLPTLSENLPDAQTQYGKEWHNTRDALYSWRLDPSTCGTGNCDRPALTPDQQLDLLNISESFRFSALIYLTRLALPSIPSADRRIQEWVQSALNYIRLVCSDVYLLWPLFVTGSECVTERDRDIIRQRCVDIQKDSGFSNNASCLKVLEKIWASEPNTAGFVNKSTGFKWRSVMHPSIPEGEYIVV
jgi:Fungal specific transcription factor domain